MRLLVIFLLLIYTFQLKAVGPYTDPSRALAIKLCSESAEKSMKAITATQMLNSTGHKWLEDEVTKTTGFQREFNNYLDNFRVSLALVAEVYGLYYEMNKTMNNITALESVVSESPTNVLAVAFSAKRNNIYQTVMAAGADVLADIRKLFLEGAKMTGQQRQEIIHNIRPKLHAVNRQLRMLTLYIKYTSLNDVWREIIGRGQNYKISKRKDIAEKCLKDWKSNIGIK